MSLWFPKKAPSDCEAQCPDCGVILSRLADMNRHQKTKHPHGTETKFPCPWFGCGYEATQKGNVKSHVDARHSDGPKYPCPECDRRFTDAAARIRHRKKMHGYVPYHTKEYLARQALNRKERVVQGASKAVSNKGRHQQVALPIASSSVPPPAPKLSELAYHDDSWKMPVDHWQAKSQMVRRMEHPEKVVAKATNIPHSYPLQPLPSQGVILSLPFETWPGYDIPNAIQNFPSVAQSPPSLTPSDFTMNYYSGLDAPQLYTTQSREQQFGESLTGGHGVPPYNGNGLWN